jgi:hypothetical protein
MFDMRTRALFILLVALVLLMCLWLFKPARSSLTAGDFSVVFIGLTNDPGPTIRRQMSVISDGRGLHALFAVTNISQEGDLNFGISTIETQSGEDWIPHKSKVFAAPLGLTWSPRHAAIYAVPWPDGLAAVTPWRLRLWVTQDPKPIFDSVNQILKRDLFRPHGRPDVISSVVKPGANTGSAQRDSPVSQSQAVRSETNRTSPRAGLGR